MNNHIRVVEKLLQGNANPLAIAKNNWTPMLMAFRQVSVCRVCNLLMFRLYLS